METKYIVVVIISIMIGGGFVILDNPVMSREQRREDPDAFSANPFSRPLLENILRFVAGCVFGAVLCFWFGMGFFVDSE